MLSRLRYDMLLHRGRGSESLSQGVTPQIGLLESIFGPIAIESPSEAVENGLNYYSKLSLDSKSTVITVITAESPPITPKSALFCSINELLFNISALPRRRRAKVSDGSPESSSKVCRQKRGRCETIVTVH